jgi:acyl dehydratase
MAISTDLIGTALAPVTHSWDDREVMLYALGVGARPPLDQAVLDEHGGLAVLQTYALIPNWWVMKDARDLLGVEAPIVHASQDLELLRPIGPEGAVTVTAEVAAVWDKGSNSLVEIAAEGVDEAGPLFRTRSATMVLGIGGWGGERGPSTPKGDDPGPPDEVFDDVVRPEQSAIYRLLGDRNPLHIDPERARAAGFDDVFLHGLCTMGFAGRAVVHAVGGGDPGALRQLGCRFAKPVMLDGPLRTEIWRGPGGSCTFRTLQGDVVVLASGQARVEA